MTAILSDYVDRFRTLKTAWRLFSRSLRRAPRRWVVLVITVAWLLSLVLGNVYAHAATDATSVGSTPFLAGLTATDTEGVPVHLYATLPIDRGDAWTASKTAMAFVVDFIWIGHLGAIAWIISFLDWLLSFEWVAWLAEPLNGIARNFENITQQIDWIPFALVIAGGVGGLVVFLGRTATGLFDMAISVICSLLAVGILANPVATITGDNGALRTAQEWGGTLAAAITTDGQMDAPAEDLLSETVTSPLITTFVRLPAQSIAFGHELTGECDAVFTNAVMESNPLEIGDTAVRDRVGECDEVAKTYVQNPTVAQAATAILISFGAFWLFLLALGLAVLLVGAIVMLLWDLFRAMFLTYVAILPGVARYALWKSLTGVAFGLVSVVGSLVLLAVFLTVIVGMLRASSGVGIVMQMNMISLLILVLVFVLWRFHRSAKKSGEKLAERLAKLGLGGGIGAKPNRTAALLTMGEASRFARDLMNKQGAPVKRIAAPSAVPGPVDVGHLQATPTGTPAAPAQRALSGGQAALPAPDGAAVPPERRRRPQNGSKAAATANLVYTAADALKAAPSGVGGVAARLALSAARNGAANALERRSTPRSSPVTAEEPRRRVVVGSDGTGHIDRPTDRTSSTVYDVSSLPRPERSARNLAVRAALTKAQPVRS